MRHGDFFIGCCAVGLGIVAAAPAAGAGTPAEPSADEAVYRVRQQIVIRDLPADAGTVRVWCWIPDDDDAQRTCSLTIAKAPRDFLIVREPRTGTRYLFAEIDEPGREPIEVETLFTVERRRVSVSLPEGCGGLSEADRAEMGRELCPRSRNMEVTDEIRALADRICGDERDVARQVRMLYAYVVDETDHYSKGGEAPKSSGMGSAAYCIANKGGGCTDQHALFIALARARDIPARLSFGSRLKDSNEGVPVDPGYRCWVEYYLAPVGWVPTDCAAGDTVAGMRDFYVSGLDENRIRFAHGRDLELPGAAGSVDYFVGAYAEVDGRPHDVERLMTFNRIERGEAQ